MNRQSLDMSDEKPFTWWWPSSRGGAAVFGAILGVSALTVLIHGAFAIINVALWYLAAVGVRFVYVKATGKHPAASQRPRRQQSSGTDPDDEEFRRWRADLQEEVKPPVAISATRRFAGVLSQNRIDGADAILALIVLAGVLVILLCVLN